MRLGLLKLFPCRHRSASSDSTLAHVCSRGNLLVALSIFVVLPRILGIGRFLRGFVVRYGV